MICGVLSADWLNWVKYRQFWSQAAQWSLRKVENADFNTDVTVDKGEGVINVEALDEKGNYKNFLNLQAAVVSPKGEKINEATSRAWNSCADRTTASGTTTHRPP